MTKRLGTFQDDFIKESIYQLFISKAMSFFHSDRVNQDMQLQAKLFGRYGFDRLGILYIVALSSIAIVIIISQLLIQNYIRKQETDSRVINIAGRQRMLSQRITKAAVLLTCGDTTLSKETRLAEIKESLELWTRVHKGLLEGDNELEIPGENSPEIKSMFAVIVPHHEAVAQNAQKLIELFAQNPSPASEQLHPILQHILQNEQPFLKGMNEIVYQYDKEAKDKLGTLRKIEFALLFVSLLVILCEIFYIFKPTTEKVRLTINELAASEEKTKKMFREIEGLYGSLEQAYMDLANVDMEAELAFIYAKTDKNGDFTYVSEKLRSSVATVPPNFFRWLEAEGYNYEFVHQVHHIVATGNTWNGEIRISSDEGDFNYLDTHIVPINEKDGTIFIINCIDITERKEAEERARELTKEKIENSLRQQKYRSALILEGQEEERRRISRDIHDGIGQLLTALKFTLEAIQPQYPSSQKYKDAKDLLKKVMQEVRRVSFDLTPSALSDYGISGVIKKYCAEVSRLSDLEIRFENKTGVISRYDKSIETNIYRIVQEALNNAIKYSKASLISVTITGNSSYLEVEVADNGQGFDFEKYTEEKTFGASGRGLFNMEERASFINATLEVRSKIGAGTSIILHIPLD